jgi:two-component system, OmpR family, sensor kinase
MPRSLRLRSIVAAAVAVLLALVVVGVVVDVLVARHLNRSLDRTLRQRAVEVAQLSASAPALLTSPGALDAPLGGQQLEVQVVDRRGRIVARSLALGGRVLPLEPVVRSVVASGRPRYANVDLGSDELRAYVAPLAETGGPAAGGAVAVAGSTHDISSTLGSVHLFVVLGALAAAALAALVLAVLMGRALDPLGRLARAAAEIERTGDPSRRLPEPASGDELVGLAQTLNAMLASLERAREAERRFLADASHELRTPLTALLGNVAYLARHGASPEVVAELEADAHRLGSLADDLLTLSREEATAPPDDVVRLDEIARTVAAEDGAVDVHVTAEPVSVRGDRAALERALANLLHNARRYGPPGGRISVEVREDDGAATLSVTDEGRGLQPYEATRAFERFWRGRSGIPGSGLGLAIVRATAERHGGRAYAQGARITIELPALRDLSESSARTRVEPPPKGPT